MGVRDFNFLDLFSRSNTYERNSTDLQVIWQALNKSCGVIEFDLSGQILYANDIFLNVVGYKLNEIVGQHHSLFCDSDYAKSIEYKQFWEKLNRGQFDSHEYKRKTKDNKTIWIQASYNPVFDSSGRPYKIIKFATDITATKMKNLEYEGRVQAVGKSQAVIEFNLDGTIITANDIFLDVLGYKLNEVVGQHHRIFCTKELANSEEYEQFWKKLNQGHFEVREYKRITKSGKEVWIHASYNPIFDIDGKPYKVIKYATDITQLINLKHMIMAMGSAAGELENAGQQLDMAANQMYRNIKLTADESAEAVEMSCQVLTGVQTVATNTEEMVASIREISRSTHESSKMSNDTLKLANDANENISKLSQSSSEIGEVVKVISNIAQQTNLLALNATIEAARAGEAGKGFAVVANEVKELAKQTAIATKNISSKIGAIQNDSSVAVSAISEISRAIDSLNQIAGNIAAAVEEQTATTNEVSRVVNESGRNVDQINVKISNLSSASSKTNVLAEETLNSAKLINKIALSLKSLVAKAEF